MVEINSSIMTNVTSTHGMIIYSDIRYQYSKCVIIICIINTLMLDIFGHNGQYITCRYHSDDLFYLTAGNCCYLNIFLCTYSTD